MPPIAHFEHPGVMNFEKSSKTARPNPEEKSTFNSKGLLFHYPNRPLIQSSLHSKKHALVFNISCRTVVGVRFSTKENDAHWGQNAMRDGIKIAWHQSCFVLFFLVNKNIA